MLKLGPYVDLFFAICYHMLDNIWATYNLVVFENTLHMGHIWATYGPQMGCPYAAHMWPICFGRSSGTGIFLFVAEFCGRLLKQNATSGDLDKPDELDDDDKRESISTTCQHTVLPRCLGFFFYSCS